ncbi:uncharacterized protein YcsI (UPF0317 family) [Salsuginibacillus halophilus]|uniref:Uncharacterized protein YcsI (UPF0317 family) n=2 Tax=Salsuginibacillus halophilus TaxID=517424 RepID=A0A2P8HQW0_9BACI|nr:putative hydro-lyase [Salsuginibacillus halophilus]PSL48599.1 uncharacterized protein YcsI (UPF0317 family) [Salsuginibacillus halophilus]
MHDPSTFRMLVRNGGWQGSSAGVCDGYIQTNLVVVPNENADAFRRFTEFNPKSCPVLDELPPGAYHSLLAPDADVRTDVPRYRVYAPDGSYTLYQDVTSIWDDTMTGFLIGCSFTFEAALEAAGLPLRHVEEKRNVPMYVTNVATEAVAPFSGPLVVSMRPMMANRVAKAEQITARYPSVHGAPVHAGDPAALGINDLAAPDYGDAVSLNPGEVPVFWACGVTPQQALLNAGLRTAITHDPGCMLVTDTPHEAYEHQ